MIEDKSRMFRPFVEPDQKPEPQADPFSTRPRRFAPDYGFQPVEQRANAQIARQNIVSETLNERGKRYGVFTGHAEITQRLKGVIAEELTLRGKFLADDQQEALDMICHKIGRILNGDADYDDSWIDIAGYAQLVVDRLRGKAR